MHKKSYLLAAILVVALMAVPALAQDKKPELPKRTFTPVKEFSYRTPVLSQGATGTCWSFSATSFMESELDRLGKGKYDLSELYTVYKTYVDKADYYVRMHGNSTFSQGAHLYDTVMTYVKDGAVPHEAYTGLLEGDKFHNHGEMVNALKAYLDAMVGGRRPPSAKWKPGFIAIMDSYIGKAPESFEYKGKKYTPKEFAAELGLVAEDYIMFTSFTHMPFWEASELVLPDNWKHYKNYYNLPIDDYMKVWRNAFENGFTAVFAGDVSEKFFDQRTTGYAIMDTDLKKFGKVTQEERQAMWDAGKTTDDHGMHAVGMAKDENGEVYYLVKNSWGNVGPFNGHIYIHENYMRGKLESFMIHKDAIPEDIRKKLNIK